MVSTSVGLLSCVQIVFIYLFFMLFVFEFGWFQLLLDSVLCEDSFGAFIIYNVGCENYACS